MSPHECLVALHPTFLRRRDKPTLRTRADNDRYFLCQDTFHDMQKASDGRSIQPRFADQGCSGACPGRRSARDGSHLGPVVPHDRRTDPPIPQHGPRDGNLLHVTGTTARLRRPRKALEIGSDICGRSCLGSSPPRVRFILRVGRRANWAANICMRLPVPPAGRGAKGAGFCPAPISSVARFRCRRQQQDQPAYR